MNYILKGDLIYSLPDKSVVYKENSYLICSNKTVAGVFDTIPKQYEHFPIHDYQNKLIIPGMTDLHVHAPQYAFRGLGMDLELMDWLNVHTFPEESRFEDLTYAKEAYEIFVSDLLTTTTTRACIFATLHTKATLLLMELLEKSGLHTYVGKVNMDRNGVPELQEKDAATSSHDTKEWITQSLQSFSYTKPILTPRFIPSCSDELMRKIKELQNRFHLPVQSHLSENLSEIAFVKELAPAASCYGDAYHMFGLFGQEVPTVMAHCIYSEKEEIQLMKQGGVYIAHCPESNINLASGIAPVRQYLEMGMHVGLGSDVAAASSLNLLSCMAMAIQASKMYYRLIDQSKKPLTFEEVFCLATLEGGRFFGKVGSFLDGYAFDAVILDDSSIQSPRKVNLKERMERAMYLASQIKVLHKYVDGKFVF